MAGRDRSRHKQLNPECSRLRQMEDLELGSESLTGAWMERSFPRRENGMGESLRDPEECEWCGHKGAGWSSRIHLVQTGVLDMVGGHLLLAFDLHTDV